MRHIIQPLLVATLLSSCAASGPERAVVPEEPRLLLVGIDMASNPLSKANIFVEFSHSPSMSELLRKQLSDKGMLVSNDRDASEYILVISGDFWSKGKYNVAPMELGPIFDSAQIAANRSYKIGDDRRNALDAAILFTGAEAFSSGYFNQMGAGIIESISKASGISGWVNEKLVGDPKGICFKDCEEREYSRQRARVEVKVYKDGHQIARFGRAAESYQKTFMPNLLIQMALEATLQTIATGTFQ